MTTPAWAFVLDGHVFYVLNDVNGETLVYDGTTQQWFGWYTGPERGVWNMFRGVVWKGRVIAADEILPKIWELDASSFVDEEAIQISRVVTAFQPARGKTSVRQGSVRITASVGYPSQVDAEVQLRFSDDEGQSWSNPHVRVLEADAYGQVLRFRSLGRIRAPGRIIEVSDTGGLVTIEGADSDEV